jgi:hypothetical protein
MIKKHTAYTLARFFRGKCQESRCQYALIAGADYLFAVRNAHSSRTLHGSGTVKNYGGAQFPLFTVEFYKRNSKTSADIPIYRMGVIAAFVTPYLIKLYPLAFEYRKKVSRKNILGQACRNEGEGANFP